MKITTDKKSLDRRVVLGANDISAVARVADCLSMAAKIEDDPDVNLRAEYLLTWAKKHTPAAKPGAQKKPPLGEAIPA